MKNNACNNQYFNMAMEFYSSDAVKCCKKYIKRTFPNGDINEIAYAIDCVLESIEDNNFKKRREY